MAAPVTMVTMMFMMLLAIAKRRLRNFRGWKLTHTATATPLSPLLCPMSCFFSFLLASSVHDCSDELLPHGRQRPTHARSPTAEPRQVSSPCLYFSPCVTIQVGPGVPWPPLRHDSHGQVRPEIRPMTEGAPSNFQRLSFFPSHREAFEKRSAPPIILE